MNSRRKNLFLPAMETPGYEVQLTQDLVRLAKLGVRPRAMVIQCRLLRCRRFFKQNFYESSH